MPHPFRLAAAALAFGLGLSVAATAEDPPAGKQPPAKAVSDAEFVLMAASGGMFEVESSKLAQQAGQSAEVKKFAEKMIADHEKANKELKEVAGKANLEVPTKLAAHHQKLLEKIQAAKGADFDKAYMAAQVVSHEEAVALFAAAAQTAKDPNIKAFAAKTLPVIKDHLEHAKHHGGKGGRGTDR